MSLFFPFADLFISVPLWEGEDEHARGQPQVWAYVKPWGQELSPYFPASFRLQAIWPVMSHLSVGVRGLQTSTTASAFTGVAGIWTQVVRHGQQMLLPAEPSGPPTAASHQTQWLTPVLSCFQIQICRAFLIVFFFSTLRSQKWPNIVSIWIDFS